MITVSTDLARQLARAKARRDALQRRYNSGRGSNWLCAELEKARIECQRAGDALADELIANRHHETESDLPRGRLIAVMYCPMIYESTFEVVSLHRTHSGAVAAMRRLKADCPYDRFNAYRYGVFGVEGS